MERITSKHQMYRLLNAGLLGHTLPAAETLEEARELFTRLQAGSYAVRSKKAGGFCVFDLTEDKALELVQTLPLGSWNLTPQLEHQHRRCYGHLYDGPGGLRLLYIIVRNHCRLLYDRDGCEQHRLDGLLVHSFLMNQCDQRGYDTIRDLLDVYPGHVIEFTTMASKAAAYGPTNTIIWEVRADTGEYEKWTIGR